MRFDNVPRDAATTDLLAAIEDPAARLERAARIAADAHEKSEELRRKRAVANAVLHLRRGWSKIDTYRHAGMDRWSFDQSLDWLPPEVSFEPMASSQYLTTLRNTGDTVANVVSREDLTAVVQAAAGPVANKSADSSDPDRTRVPRPHATRKAFTWQGPIAPGETITIGYTMTVAEDIDDTGGTGLTMGEVSARGATDGERWYRVWARNDTDETGSFEFTVPETAEIAPDGLVATHGTATPGDGWVRWVGDLDPDQTVSVIYTGTDRAWEWADPAAGSVEVHTDGDTDDGRIEVATARYNLIQMYAAMLGSEDEDVRLYVELLDRPTQYVADLVTTVNGSYNKELSVWAAARDVRNTLARDLMSGVYGVAWSNADVSRVTGLCTAVVSRLRGQTAA